MKTRTKNIRPNQHERIGVYRYNDTIDDNYNIIVESSDLGATVSVVLTVEQTKKLIENLQSLIATV